MRQSQWIRQTRKALFASGIFLACQASLAWGQSCGCDSTNCDSPFGRSLDGSSIDEGPCINKCTCKPHGPKPHERLLDGLDRLGNATEHRFKQLFRDVSIDLRFTHGDGHCDSGCDSCKAGQSLWSGHGEESTPENLHFGAWEEYSARPSGKNDRHVWDSTSPMEAAPSLKSPSLPRPPKNDHPVSIPSEVKSNGRSSNSISVPAKPQAPDDWKHDPFQDDARSKSKVKVRAASNSRETQSDYHRAYDPQAYIRQQKLEDRVVAGRKTVSTSSVAKSKTKSQKSSPVLRSFDDTSSSEFEVVNELSAPVHIAKRTTTESGVRRSLQDGKMNEVQTASAEKQKGLESISWSKDSAQMPKVQLEKPERLILLPVPRSE